VSPRASAPAAARETRGFCLSTFRTVSLPLAIREMRSSAREWDAVVRIRPREGVGDPPRRIRDSVSERAGLNLGDHERFQ
jgi:hypothetical protein